MSDIVESWKWLDPYSIIERLLNTHPGARIDAIWITERPPRCCKLTSRIPRVTRDRYYTQARRLHVKQLMRGI